MCRVIDNEDGRRGRYGWLTEAFHGLCQYRCGDRGGGCPCYCRHVGFRQCSSEADLQLSTAPVSHCDRRAGGGRNSGAECRLNFVFSGGGGDRGCGVGCTVDDHGKCECAFVSGCQNPDALSFAVSRLSGGTCACCDGGVGKLRIGSGNLRDISVCQVSGESHEISCTGDR